MSKMIFICLFAAWSANVLAQTVDFSLPPGPPVDKKRQLLEEIESLEKAEMADFGKALKHLNEQINEYAQTRRKECAGEYSSLEISEDGQTRKVRNKLSKEEKKLCLLELIQLRKTMARSLFNVRKKHLLDRHKRQLEHLEKTRQKTLKELDLMGQKLK